MASITDLVPNHLHPSTRKQTTSLPTKPAAASSIHMCEIMDRLCPMRAIERGQLGPAPTTNKPSIATECAVRLDACRARLAMTYRVSISKPSSTTPLIRTRHERVREPDTTPSPRRRASSFFVARPSCLSHVICQPEEMTESRLRLAPRKRSSDPDLRIKCLREHTKLIRAQKAKERAEKRALKEKEKRRERELEREKKFKPANGRKWAPATVQTTCAAVSAIAFPSMPEPEVPVAVQPAPAPAPAPATPLPTLVIEPPSQDKVVPAESTSPVTSPSSPVTDGLDDLSLDWKKEKKQKMMKKKSAEALVESNNNVQSGQPASSSSLEVPTEAPARKRKTSGADKSQASSSSPTLQVPEEAPVRKRKISGAEKEKKSGTDRERKKSKPKVPPVLPSIADEAPPPPLPTKEPLVKPADATPKTTDKKSIIIIKRPPCIIVPLPDSMPAVMARPDSPTPRK